MLTAAKKIEHKCMYIIVALYYILHLYKKKYIKTQQLQHKETVPKFLTLTMN